MSGTDVTHLEIVPPPNYADLVRDAAERLARARTLFAETFVLAHAQSKVPITDKKAWEMTVAATKDEITVLEAELEIAKWLMEKS